MGVLRMRSQPPRQSSKLVMFSSMRSVAAVPALADLTIWDSTWGVRGWEGGARGQGRSWLGRRPSREGPEGWGRGSDWDGWQGGLGREGLGRARGSGGRT